MFITIITVDCKYYPNITNERIVGHDIIAPSRKTDLEKGLIGVGLGVSLINNLILE